MMDVGIFKAQATGAVDAFTLDFAMLIVRGRCGIGIVRRIKLWTNTENTPYLPKYAGNQ